MSTEMSIKEMFAKAEYTLFTTGAEIDLYSRASLLNVIYGEFYNKPTPAHHSWIKRVYQYLQL